MTTCVSSVRQSIMDLCLVVAMVALLATGRSQAELFNLTMPGADPKAEDSYLCTSFVIEDLKVPTSNGAVYLKGFQPSADGNVAHHMLLYACSEASQPPGIVFDCLSQSMCRSQQMILFGWAKNADAITMPKDVSMHLNVQKTKYLVLQIHYAQPLSKPDTSTTLNIDVADEK